VDRIVTEGIGLEVEDRGAGEPVVLIHAGVCADWFRGLRDEPALACSYRVISYHRAGYAGSDRVDGPFSIRQQARQCRSLLRHLGIARAHVVGHSSGAAIALQLALDHPDAVHSLALLETALLTVPSGPFAGDAVRAYLAGDRAAAVDIWMRGVCGPDYRTVMDRVLPGAVDRAVSDAATFFGQELPAVREWTFDRSHAERITRPALRVLGARSGEVSPAFGRRHDLLLAWLPRAEPFVLPDATHLLQVQNPVGLARGLARFFTGHPIE
jgi:pimeloyl-ACP methyl ester carboxylesterase